MTCLRAITHRQIGKFRDNHLLLLFFKKHFNNSDIYITHVPKQVKLIALISNSLVRGLFTPSGLKFY